MTSPPEHLRILHLVDHVDRLGNGITNMVVDLACGQAQAGHTVTVHAHGGAFEDLLSAHGVDVVLATRAGGLRGRARALIELAGVLRRARPNVVHAHYAAATAFAWILRPVARHRVVATAHNVFERKTALMRVADRTIALSNSVRDDLIGQGIEPARVRVVLNGPLGTPRSTADPAVAMSLAGPAVVTVAGLYRRKGIDVLIHAFEEITLDGPSDPHLYIVGDGPDRAEFEALAAAGPAADRIHFVGFVSEPATYLMLCDVFVLASRREAFPLVVLEARAAGCAIVATDVDGVAEALDDGSAGLLVPNEDVPALRGAIVTILTEPAVGDRLRRAAGAGLERFSVERMALETEHVYRELLDRPRSSARIRRT